MYEVDREKQISQSDVEPVMTTNALVQNANDVAELVFAMVLISARNSFTDAPSHDERQT